MISSKYKLVYLEWWDTTSPVSVGWQDVEDALKWGEYADYWVCQTGFILKETKKYILLCESYNITAESGNELVNVRGLTKIPTTWIKNRKFIKL